MSKWKLNQFYVLAKEYLSTHGYQKEIDHVEQRRFEDQTSKIFFWEYVFVICNSGMKNQVAEKIYASYIKDGISAIRHPGKKKAIDEAELNYGTWFMFLQDKKSDAERIEFLESLPWIGPTTKYHLARNLGIDCAKPDRHLVRIAEVCGYDDVQKMCTDISKRTGDRIGTVDVVLWRFCNLVPNAIERLKN